MDVALFLIAIALAALGLWRAREFVRETTLVATWWWAAFALSVNFAAELSIRLSFASTDDAILQPCRFAARMTLFCPAISLLGVKRPQDTAWNFVVASLWAIVSLPAAENLILHPGEPLAIGGARSWFLLVLLLMCLVQTLPTNQWLATLLATGALACLAREFLPLGLLAPRTVDTTPYELLAVSSALLLIRSPHSLATEPLDRLWLDFRDSFGLFWSLRVQERLNAAAEQYNWPIRLAWNGWRSTMATSVELSDEHRREAMQTFRGLLRRFTTQQWISKRTSHDRENASSS